VNLKKYRTITLSDGSQIQILFNARRVMGLSPAITEMLFNILPDSQIVAVTTHCNYPEALIKGKPKIGVLPLDIEQIIKIKPEVIFSEEGMTNPQDVAQLRKLGFAVVVFSYQKTTDILNAMDSIRTWIVSRKEAKKRIDTLQVQLLLQENKYKNLSLESRPKILAITWLDPIFAYGYETWMTDKIWLAGGRNILSEKLDKPYPVIQRETILKLNPDVIFGGNFEKMDSTFFKQYPELRKTNAYKNQMVFSLNDDLASRPGPRFLFGIKEIELFLTGKSSNPDQ